jgi:3-methylcrotonyl-CoA carboxylase alpha subunit
MVYSEHKIKSLLVANRGEIACRIFKSAKELGIKCIAIHSLADKNAQHVEMADESYSLNSNEASSSYLDVKKIIKICKKAKVDAIHPGYGFLSENSVFAKEVEKAGIIFIGPSYKSQELLGNKKLAKELAKKVSVPTVQGFNLPDNNKNYKQDIDAFAKKLNFPLVIKAAAGGGGRGMRIVRKISELKDLIESARREALAAFGDASLFIEKLVEGARHIEVQIIGDKYGNIAHLFERDCSLQRNHQKIIEEAPAPGLSQKLREKLYQAAMKLCRSAKYSNAGTVEFLVDKKENFYFLEVNARLQVEHPVTEAITGVDLVKCQIEVAEGKKLKNILPKNLTANGSAIECRICSEIPSKNFTPSIGKIKSMLIPQEKHLRIDTGYRAGDTIPALYDSLVAKLIVHETDRNDAVANIQKILKNTFITGVHNNLGFLSFLVESKEFAGHSFHSKSAELLLPQYIKSEADNLKQSLQFAPLALATCVNANQESKTIDIWNKHDAFRIHRDEEQSFNFTVNADKKEISTINNKLFESYTLSKVNKDILHLNIGNKVSALASFFDNKTWIKYQNDIFAFELLDKISQKSSKIAAHNSIITSTLPGKIVRINVSVNEEISEGEELLILESMKLEHVIRAPAKCKVEAVLVEANQRIETKQELIKLSYK